MNLSHDATNPRISKIEQCIRFSFPFCDFEINAYIYFYNANKLTKSSKMCFWNMKNLVSCFQLSSALVSTSVLAIQICCALLSLFCWALFFDTKRQQHNLSKQFAEILHKNSSQPFLWIYCNDTRNNRTRYKSTLSECPG